MKEKDLEPLNGEKRGGRMKKDRVWTHKQKINALMNKTHTT